MTVPDRVIQRVLTKVRAKDGSSNCINTTYSTGSHGYGQVGWHEGGQRRMTLTHRVAWEAYHGPIPDGLTVDHICHNRICINPRHLRLLTNEQNASDNGYATRTHCPQGHEYAGENLYINPKGERLCRACARLRRQTRAT